MTTGNNFHPPPVELTILMPCLNEAETVGTCVRKARDFLERTQTDGEVLVADNGSNDGSAEVALAAGARVVSVPTRGNGAALHGGIRSAAGKYIIMADADDSYDFLHLDPFLEQLRSGADLVIGNRFAGGIAPGAMPFLHRYVGNPGFSLIGRLFFHTKVRDFHCGLRGFRADKFRELGMSALGFEFCSEMVIKAAFQGWTVTEVPTTLSPDGRSRKPHLKTWRDGFRHLRFFLLFSPRWLFFYPGLALMMLGVILGTLVTVISSGLSLGNLNFDVDSLVGALGMVLVGYQAVIFAVLTALYASSEGFMVGGKWTRRARALRHGWIATASLMLMLAGVAGLIISLEHWYSDQFGTVDPRQVLRIVVPSVAALAVGAQTLTATLFAGILQIRHETPHIEFCEVLPPPEANPDPVARRRRQNPIQVSPASWMSEGSTPAGGNRAGAEGSHVGPGRAASDP
jgi:glycosyltransferase involved in cell wall biosynthesis